MARWQITPLVGVAAAAIGVPAAGQTPRTTTLRGWVVDSLRPLPGATVELLGAKRKVETSETGEFLLDGLDPGRYWISIRRIGYEPFAFSATLDADSTRTLKIVLSPAPYRLKDLEVTAITSGYRFYDFDRRSRSGWGRFLTRDDIRRFNAIDAIDVVLPYLPGRSRWVLEQSDWSLLSEPGMRMTMGVGSRQHLSSFGSPADWNCAPGVSIDGGSVFAGNRLSDYRADDIEAIEVYRRGSWVPIEFANQATRCGLVVLWLK
jgi:hypothetical protein